MVEIPRHFQPGPTKRRLLRTEPQNPAGGDDTTEHGNDKCHGDVDRALAAPATEYAEEKDRSEPERHMCISAQPKIYAEYVGFLL